jgi:hypothetical protein
VLLLALLLRTVYKEVKYDAEYQYHWEELHQPPLRSRRSSGFSGVSRWRCPKKKVDKAALLQMNPSSQASSPLFFNRSQFNCKRRTF